MIGGICSAHDKALSIENIRSGFHGTDIHSFEPNKVLNRIASSNPSIQIRPSTSPISVTPFNDAVLISSPIDFDVV